MCKNWKQCLMRFDEFVWKYMFSTGDASGQCVILMASLECL